MVTIDPHGKARAQVLMRRIVRRIRHGRPQQPSVVDEVDDWERALHAEVAPFTLASPERVHALTESVRYVIRMGVPGAFVECGVWRGGSVLAMIRALQREGVSDRDIYLYDTFKGMTKPTDLDTSSFDIPALDRWNESEEGEWSQRLWPGWFNEELFNPDLVKEVLADTGYPVERLHFIQGVVQETIPGVAPDVIALLRLDTDWYESTRHELDHLYPRLERGGVMIIDDYGHWDGCRRAVDEYFAETNDPILLNRVDYSCRSVVKV